MINLKGKRGLVVGIANEQSIAWGCAKAFRESGAKLAVTYLNEKTEKYVRPLAEKLEADIIFPLDARNKEEVDSVFYEIRQRWGKLDFFLHSIAFAPKKDLQGRLIDCSSEGFLEAMNISCYSFIYMAKHAEQLMKKGGSLLTVSYYGSEKVIPNYNLMGPVKAALESTVRYLAYELGSKGIRVNALSPGPIATRAAGGIENFNELLDQAVDKSAEHRVTNIDAVGSYARFFISDEAKDITGNIAYIDAGLNIVGL